MEIKINDELVERIAKLKDVDVNPSVNGFDTYDPDTPQETFVENFCLLAVRQAVRIAESNPDTVGVQSWVALAASGE